MSEKKKNEGNAASPEKHSQRHLAVNQIKISRSQYARLEEDVSELRDSIEKIGLIHPLVVDKNYNLICGGRRLSALKLLGRTQIPVVVSDRDDSSNEIASIEENLQRKDFNGWQKDFALSRLQELYAEKYPETRNRNEIGGPGRGKKKTNDNTSPVSEVCSFSVAIAKRYGCSPRSIERAVTRARKSAPSVVNAWKAEHLGSSQVNLLVRLDNDSQEKLLPHLSGVDFTGLEEIVEKAKTDLAGAITLAKNWGDNETHRVVQNILDAAGKVLKQVDAITVSDQKIPLGIENKRQLRGKLDELKRKIEALTRDEDRPDFAPSPGVRKDPGAEP